MVEMDRGKPGKMLWRRRRENEILARPVDSTDGNESKFPVRIRSCLGAFFFVCVHLQVFTNEHEQKCAWYENVMLIYSAQHIYS